MIQVIKGGMNILSNMTNKERKLIEDDLTLNNPAYAQAKRYSRYGYTSVPPYLFYFESMGRDSLVVPRGYEIKLKHKVVEDTRVKVRVDYPKFKIKLRDTQREAFEAWNETREDGMLVLATGKGKSILGTYLGYVTRQKTLIVVQKNDLVDGWTKDIELCTGLTKKDIGLIKAQKFVIGEQYTITTIQTLSKLDPLKLAELYTTFGMVIVDECHHSTAKSYEIFKYFRCRYLIGLTATDNLSNGLREVQYWMFGKVAYRSKESRSDEDILPYTVILRESNLKYNPKPIYLFKNREIDEEEYSRLRARGYKPQRKPLDQQELKALLRDESFNLMVAEDIKGEYLKGKSCIAFLHEKEHIRTLESLLIRVGVPSEQIQLYYGDSKESDSVMKERAESKEVLVTIATFAKATEGTNIKSWSTAFLVTSINNEKNTIQAVGRIRRAKEGKEECLVYDYIHPNVLGLSNHINTRMKAYKASLATVIDPRAKRKGQVQRGWKNR